MPPGALAAPGEALGLVARAPLPRRVLPARRRSSAWPAGRGAGAPGLGGGRRPVEIAVSGADALLADRAVAVWLEGRRRGDERTGRRGAGPHLRRRAPVSRCWRCGRAPKARGRATTAAATLGLTKRQALRLIAAESFARKVTLLPEG